MRIGCSDALNQASFVILSHLLYFTPFRFICTTAVEKIAATVPYMTANPIFGNLPDLGRLASETLGSAKNGAAVLSG